MSRKRTSPKSLLPSLRGCLVPDVDGSKVAYTAHCPDNGSSNPYQKWLARLLTAETPLCLWNVLLPSTISVAKEPPLSWESETILQATETTLKWLGLTLALSHNLLLTTLHSIDICQGPTENSVAIASICVAGPVMRGLPHLQFTKTLWSRCYSYPHFTNEETGTESNMPRIMQLASAGAEQTPRLFALYIIVTIIRKTQPLPALLERSCTVMCHLTMVIHSEKCVIIKRFHCCTVIECTYTNLEVTAYYTPRLYGI